MITLNKVLKDILEELIKQTKLNENAIKRSQEYSEKFIVQGDESLNFMREFRAKSLQSITNPQLQAEDKDLKYQDKVKKMGGDYEFEGVIVCKFHKTTGKIRYVVENKDGILHIFSGNQLLSTQ